MLLVFSACHIWTLFTSHLHMYISSAYYLSICVLCAYYLQWSLISSFLTSNANVIYMSSLVLYRSYDVQLSFCTLSVQMHIVHVICMLSCTCRHHLLVISNTPHIPLQLDSSPRNSKTQKVKETRLISQKVK